VYDLEAREMFISLDVVFHENVYPFEAKEAQEKMPIGPNAYCG